MSGVPVEELSGNLVLASLEGDDQASLAAGLKRVHYALGDLVFAEGGRLEEVCFPTTGVISLVAGTSDGTQVEVATVGNEGLVGLPLLFGGRDSGNVRAVCQMPSDALVISAEHFAAWLGVRDRRIPTVMEAYVQLHFIQAAQSVVCNRLHAIDQRCARWLLLCHDRAPADEFPITHEFLAQMLGVRRASVTITVRHLQRLGLIDHRRGAVRIADRAGLETASCECYGVVRSAQHELLPARPPTRSRRPVPSGQQASS